MAPGYVRPVVRAQHQIAPVTRPADRLIYTGLSEALAELEAQGKPMDAKAFRKAQKSTQDLGEGGSSGVTCGKYCLAFVCPCSIICCDSRGAAVGTSKKNKIVGMTAVMDYVIACKNAPAHYHWEIQNYHYETTYSTDEDGNTTSSEERVDTHFARTGGALVSTDATPPFQPNVTKASVALKSAVECAPDAFCAGIQSPPADVLRLQHDRQSSGHEGVVHRRRAEAHGARRLGRPRGRGSSRGSPEDFDGRDGHRPQLRGPDVLHGRCLAQGD